MAFVEYQKKGHIVTITLNRPDRLNALGKKVTDEIVAACKKVDSDPEARVAIITGAGRAFCAGNDVREMHEVGGPPNPVHAAYVIARVLDFGNIEDVHALRKIYPDEKIVETVRTRRNLLPKTGKYWAVKLNIPLEEVPCLKRYYHLKQST